MNQTEKGASGWTVETLFVHFTALLEAQEKKNQQQFLDSEKAVQAALQAAQKAVDKAEFSLIGWKESQNEWRGTIADIISKTAGKGAGLNAGWAYLVGAFGLILTIIGIYVALHK